MTVVVVGYIKNFKLPLTTSTNEEVKIIEGVSERIDYIRANNLEKKESFTLVPKYVTDISDSGKQTIIFIKKIDILMNLRKKKKYSEFGYIQSTPFFDSRQILVVAQKLKDLFPINTLVINYGSVTDSISYLKSAGAQIYNIQSIFIHNKVKSKEVLEFLNDHHFKINEENNNTTDYISFKNDKPNIKSLIFKEPSDILDYIQVQGDIDADIIAINWNTQLYLPFDKFFPCKDSTIYFDGNSFSERIKNLVLFGNGPTMIRLANVLKDKRIIFLESLKIEGFQFTSFN